MQTFKRFLEIIDINIVFCIIPMILFLLLIQKLFSKKVQTQTILNIIRWFVLFYTLLNLTYFIIGIVLFPEEFSIINRASGPYAALFWLMTLGALLLPMTLFYKKLGTNPFYIILVLFLMKSGHYFERFVIFMTCLHRNYLDDSTIDLYIKGFILVCLQGFFLVIILYFFIYLYDKYKLSFNRNK